LPFVSYGGSSLVAAGIGLGMLLAFTRTRPQSDMSDIFGIERSAPRIVRHD
jgi:cell division protein FtsW